MKLETYHYIERSKNFQNANILHCIVQPKQAKSYLSYLKEKNNKTQELWSDVNLLKSLGAKDALKIAYPTTPEKPFALTNQNQAYSEVAKLPDS